MSKEKFRLIADSLPELVWAVGSDGKVVYINSTYQRYVGFSPETINQMFSLVYPDDLELSKEAWRNAIHTIHSFEVVHRVRRHDGVYRWFIARGIPVRDENAEIVEWYGAATDIHDLRELQKELETIALDRTERLRISEETYRHLFEYNLAGTFRAVFDPVTREIGQIDCNDAYARMHGYSLREDLIADKSFFTSFANENERNTFFDQLIKKRKLINYESHRLRKDGRPIWILTNVSLRPIEGSEGIFLLEGTVVDITDRKKAEEEMRAAHERLRAMASEMVRTEERERQHIATVLHDTIAQTLAAIKMQFESVQEHVTSNGLKLMAKTRDLITESIRQTRSIMVELSPPILYELGFIPALESLTEQVTAQHGIRIEFDSRDDFEPLSHNIEVLLYTATRELLMNIVKHAKANNAVVTVSGKKGKIQIEVSDNGVGFDKSKTGYRKDLSGGFGLFSIQERLKHFGGELDIKSTRGKGTKITMITPRTVCQGKDEEKAAMA